MSREEMENAIVRNYVDVIKSWVYSDNDLELEDHVAERIYSNFKGMDLADIQAEYEEVNDGDES